MAIKRLMINAHVAYDHLDANVGEYFNKCQIDIRGLLDEEKLFNVVEIPSRVCNQAYIDLVVGQDPNKFLFIAYCHGNDLGISSAQGNFVQCQVNTHHFKASLFYTNACYAGSNLADALIADGCSGFIGYSKRVFALLEENERLSIACDNAGLKAFLSKDITLKEAFDFMYSYISQEIAILTNTGDILSAGTLMTSRESLVCKGNLELRFKDLLLNQL